MLRSVGGSGANREPCHAVISVLLWRMMDSQFVNRTLSASTVLSSPESPLSVMDELSCPILLLQAAVCECGRTVLVYSELLPVGVIYGQD